MAADGGVEALAVKPQGGSKPKLSQEQLDQLVQWLAGRDPRQLQFDFALWTRRMVRDLIKREFDVDYTPQAVGQLLRRLGFSPQRPLVRAYEQNPDKVAHWKAVEFPKIRDLAAEQGATVLFADEASVRTDHHSGTTWAPVGQTPVVTGTGNRSTVNMISAVSLRGELHFSFLDGAGTSERFIEFCRKLLHDIDKPIFLIVDGHSAHTAKATKAFVASTDGRLSLFFLPPYSPELNPDEWVWKNIKHDVAGRTVPRTGGELRTSIERGIERLRRTPTIIRGFFRAPTLTYINAT